MDYKVTLTLQATEQIHNTMLYIARTLMQPETARLWTDLLYREIGKLGFMPSRFQLAEEEPWHTKGVHKLPVKNFLVYYIIDEDSKTVSVIAVIYGRRDQLGALASLSDN